MRVSYTGFPATTQTVELGAGQPGERFGPSTPSDRIIQNRVHYGPTWYVGVKGTF